MLRVSPDQGSDVYLLRKMVEEVFDVLYSKNLHNSIWGFGWPWGSLHCQHQPTSWLWDRWHPAQRALLLRGVSAVLGAGPATALALCSERGCTPKWVALCGRGERPAAPWPAEAPAVG